MKPKVVILLSDKRSGSTMFQRELCKHPDIRTVDYSPHAYLETHHWLKAAVMLDLAPSLFSGGRVYAGYGSRKNARTYMEDCIKGNVPEFKIPADDRKLVFSGWEALCERFAQPVFFEKSPHFLAHRGCLQLILEWMQQTEYDVKIIGLVRNPLSVMYSAQELFHTPPEKRQAGWVQIHENLLWLRDQLPEDQFMMVRYEELVRDPVPMFGNIFRFIAADDFAEAGAGVRASSLSKWESDPFFTFRLDEPTKAMARTFGYSDAELTNPEKPAPPLSLRLKKKAEGSATLALARIRDRIVAPIRLRRNLKSDAEI